MQWVHGCLEKDRDLSPQELVGTGGRDITGITMSQTGTAQLEEKAALSHPRVWGREWDPHEHPSHPSP